MTALIVVTGLVVLGSGLFVLWCLLTISKKSDEQAQAETQDVWVDLVSLQQLAAERARQEMRDRLVHARARSVRDGRDD
jgi:hypothetical protein